jgi:hypothetical protein
MESARGAVGQGECEQCLPPLVGNWDAAEEGRAGGTDSCRGSMSDVQDGGNDGGDDVDDSDDNDEVAGTEGRAEGHSAERSTHHWTNA